MPEFKTKLYPHITGVGGPEGRPGVLAVTAALDPSPHYPEIGRLIIGTPVASDKVTGPLPDLGGFMMSVEGAENLIATLQQAVSDVRAATGARPPTRWEQGSHLDGFERIGRIDAVGRRSLWLKEESGAFELRAGREGDDAHVRIEQAGHDAPGERKAVLMHLPLRNPPNPVVIKLSPSRFGVLNDVMTRARFAAEWEQKNGFALAATGIEVNGYEDHRDLLQGDAIVLSAVVTPPSGGMEVICRIIVREGQHFAVQYRAGDDDWRPVAFSAVGFTPDAVLASVMASMYAGIKPIDGSHLPSYPWSNCYVVSDGSRLGFLRTEVRIDLRRSETSPAAPGQHAVDLKQGQPGGGRDAAGTGNTIPPEAGHRVRVETTSRGPRIVITLGGEDVVVSPSGAIVLRDELGKALESLKQGQPGGGRDKEDVLAASAGLVSTSDRTSPAEPGLVSVDEKAPDIHVLWFDQGGHGPDELKLRLHPFAPEPKAPYAALGLRIRAGGLLIGDGAAMVDGGFLVDREQAAELHRQLGAWLSSTDKNSPR